ncbi:MAG: FHA domain-containing protein [Pseudomonadota bacterium]
MSDADSKALLSVDVAGSTALYEHEGDQKARTLVSDCLEIVKAVAAEHSGVVLAEVGDEVRCVFGDCTEATGAASEMHAGIEEWRDPDADVPVTLKIGLHYGPLPEEGDPLLAESMKIANWAATNAKPEQTLATSILVDQLPRIYRAVTRYVADETWTFISVQHMELHEVIWDVESITAYGGEAVRAAPKSYREITFSYENQQVVINEQHPVISVGRSPSNDLVVASDLVSRHHLSAQFSRGRGTVTDNSMNGSVVMPDGEGTHSELKRETTRISDSGQIALGKPEAGEQRHIIRYACR